MNKNFSKKEEIAAIILIIVLTTGLLIYFVNKFRGVDLEAVIDKNVAELEQLEQGYLDKLTAGMNNFLAEEAVLPEKEPAVSTDEAMIAALKKELEKSEPPSAEE